MAANEINSSRPGQKAPTEIKNAKAHAVASSDDREYDPGKRGGEGNVLKTLRPHGMDGVPEARGGNHSSGK